jgi:hypothetical protein
MVPIPHSLLLLITIRRAFYVQSNFFMTILADGTFAIAP